MLSDVVNPFLLSQTKTISSQSDMVFNNLRPITNGATVQPRPDLFDGVPEEAVDMQIRQDLDDLIVPTRAAYAPIAPNFFLEAKPIAGAPDEVARQVTYDLGLGARGIEALRNYSRDPSYDGNAYTVGASFHGVGVLQMYTAHVVAGRDGPETYVNQVGAHMMVGGLDNYKTGVRALRNGRHLAQDFRDEVVQTANDRVRQQEETEGEFVDCEEHNNLSMGPPLSSATSVGAATAGHSTHNSARHATRSKRRQTSPPSPPTTRKTRSRTKAREQSD